MDGYRYIDIFETKGIEYLVIIAFLILLIPFSILLNKKTSLAKEFKKAFNLLSSNVLDIPHGLFFSKNHIWTHLERSGMAKVGLDQLLTGISGEMRVNPLRYSDEMVRKGDVLAEIGLNGKRLRVYSPISGQIIRTNPALRDFSGVVGDPSHHEWICEIKPARWKEETSSYFMAEDAAEWFRTELERLRDFLAYRAARHSPELSMVVLQDGGEISHELLNDLPAEVWHDFQKEFLDPEENPDQSF